MTDALPGAAGGDLGRFRDVDAWVFDLDNTLYPRSANLFEQVDRRSEQARLAARNKRRGGQKS